LKPQAERLQVGSDRYYVDCFVVVVVVVVVAVVVAVVAELVMIQKRRTYCSADSS